MTLSPALRDPNKGDTCKIEAPQYLAQKSGIEKTQYCLA